MESQSSRIRFSALASLVLLSLVIHILSAAATRESVFFSKQPSKLQESNVGNSDFKNDFRDNYGRDGAQDVDNRNGYGSLYQSNAAYENAAGEVTNSGSREASTVKDNEAAFFEPKGVQRNGGAGFGDNNNKYGSELESNYNNEEVENGYYGSLNEKNDEFPSRYDRGSGSNAGYGANYVAGYGERRGYRSRGYGNGRYGFGGYGGYANGEGEGFRFEP